MTSMRRVSGAVAILFGAGMVWACAGAQQKVPFSFGIPVAPTGLADQPLPDGPFVYRTGEQQDVRVTVVTRGLEYPYSLAFLPTGELLVTERAGRLRIIRNGVLDPHPIAGGPPSRFAGKSGSIGAIHGYMSLVLHPRFVENHWIYFSYTKLLGDGGSTAAVARARLDGGSMSELRDVFVGENMHGAISLTMTPDNMLWIATGAGSDVARRQGAAIARRWQRAARQPLRRPRGLSSGDLYPRTSQLDGIDRAPRNGRGVAE